MKTSEWSTFYFQTPHPHLHPSQPRHSVVNSHLGANREFGVQARSLLSAPHVPHRFNQAPRHVAQRGQKRGGALKALEARLVRSIWDGGYCRCCKICADRQSNQKEVRTQERARKGNDVAGVGEKNNKKRSNCEVLNMKIVSQESCCQLKS
jgi:hypothetical protein